MAIEEKEKKGYKREPPTQLEMDKLESQIRLFPQRRIAGQLVSPFDQYLCSINVRKIVGTHVVCVQPEPDENFSWTNQHLELRQYGQMMAEMRRNPAKRAAWNEMLKKFWPIRANLAKQKKI